ncbi:hypothetical protein CRUP_016875 [Coryphaenoides rupestris]|nr:hypothetical protein CRUP_016875 [Coryphaenoides rupestris]
MPKSKEVLSSTSGSDSDSEVETKAKRKKPSAPEKPAKKMKGGETSRPGGSAKSSSNADDNMFQNLPIEPFYKVVPAKNLPLEPFYKVFPGKNLPLEPFYKVVPGRNLPVEPFYKVVPAKNLPLEPFYKVFPGRNLPLEPFDEVFPGKNLPLEPFYKVVPAKNLPLEPFYKIGKMRYVSVRDFKGKVLVDIREYWMNQDGEMKPGKKGGHGANTPRFCRAAGQVRFSPHIPVLPRSSPHTSSSRNVYTFQYCAYLSTVLESRRSAAPGYTSSHGYGGGGGGGYGGGGGGYGSLKAVTKTTHTTDSRMATPSIQPVSVSPSSSTT